MSTLFFMSMDGEGLGYGHRRSSSSEVVFRLSLVLGKAFEFWFGLCM